MYACIHAFTAAHYLAFHTNIDPINLGRSQIHPGLLWESVHTHLDRSWIDLSSHLSVHIQIALELDRSQIDLTH